MENIKNELNSLIDNVQIAEFFAKVDELRTEGSIEVANLHSLNQLRQEFISGGVKFDFYARLKAWISISITIIVNPNNGNRNTKSNGFCQEIKDLISKGKLEKTITKLLEILEGKEEHNEVVFLSSQYNSTTASLSKGIITNAEANQTYARITQAILALLKELCEN
jgi:hypothetical protein